MAYRSRTGSRRAVRGSRRGGYSARRRVSRRPVRSASRRSGGRGGQTVRIVLEQPSSNPMLTVPVGQRVQDSNPKRARF